ncbi:hypothetical protein LTR50_001651 [Elasticomyces elasticus]|nr:hypothetical protein LTR50_001651 [Elasticomyces elasticus]
MDSLSNELADALSSGCEIKYYHVSSVPTRCNPIFAAAPGEKPEKTYCESNFLTVSISPNDASSEVFVYAIELLVYSTKRLTTIFVSKADSTGYLTRLARSAGSQASPLKSITSVFLAWLVKHRQRPGIRTVISLFARAQDQYLFPGSIDNCEKHVLDDRGLVRWWCKTLDPVLRAYPANNASINDYGDCKTTSQAYLIVPGFDKYETTSFYPPTYRLDPVDAKRWQHGHPLREIAITPIAPPRCLIPHFPDDPKARFLDELDDEMPDRSMSQTSASPGKKGTGMWRSVKTLEQFWETMAFRQECCSGRLVGFIWVVLTPLDIQTDSQVTASSPEPARPEAPTKRKPLRGLVKPRKPRVKLAATNSAATLTESEYYTWPEDSRGQIVLDQKDYHRANELLLRLDFAPGAEKDSTRRWVLGLASMVGITSWGKTVVGRQNVPVVDTRSDSEIATIGVQNMPTMTVRKKRKVDSLLAGRDLPQTSEASRLSASDQVQGGSRCTEETAPLTAVRPPPPVPQPHDIDVNILSSNLVRKKPKV